MRTVIALAIWAFILLVPINGKQIDLNIGVGMAMVITVGLAYEVDMANSRHGDDE